MAKSSARLRALEPVLRQSSDDERRRQVLRARIGRLRGGSALVYASGSSESEMRYQTEMHQSRTIAAMRSALLEGNLARRRDGAAALRRQQLRERYEKATDLHDASRLADPDASSASALPRAAGRTPGMKRPAS